MDADLVVEDCEAAAKANGSPREAGINLDLIEARVCIGFTDCPSQTASATVVEV
ncbi:MAG TPA: hypothetical protein ACN46R_09840 [Prochlorococcus sp.]